MDIDKLSAYSEYYLKLAEKYNSPRKGMKTRWSTKYKKKINCNNPKGFSQKAYCARKKRGGNYKSDVNDAEWLDNALKKIKETAQSIADETSKKIEEIKKSFQNGNITTEQAHSELAEISSKGQKEVHQLAQESKKSDLSQDHISDIHQKTSQQIDFDLEHAIEKIKEYIGIADKKIYKPETLNGNSVVVQRARQDLNMKETEGKDLSPKIREYFLNINWKLHDVGYAWCAAAVSYWIRGQVQIKGSASVASLMQQFKSINRFVSKSEINAEHLLPGNVIFYKTSHVGIIESFNGSKVTTIEGNSGAKVDGVYRHTKDIKDSAISGIGLVTLPIKNESGRIS